jgi:mycofactocin precursor
MQDRSDPPPGTPDPGAVLDTANAEAEPPEDDAELDELLIQEITIDGMCGVY